MGHTWDQAVAITRLRRSHQEPLMRRMIDVQTRYNGEYVLPVPAAGPDDALPVLTPQLVDEAIDFPALQASSIDPTFHFPPLKIDDTRSIDRARTRKLTTAATLYESTWGLKKRKAFRHIAGYGKASLLLLPHDGMRYGKPYDEPGPRLVLRDPLTTYAEAVSPLDFRAPLNVGYVHQVSAQALMDEYGSLIMATMGDLSNAGQQITTELWDVLEWIDEENIRVGIIGPSNFDIRESFEVPALGMELRSWPNRAGCVPAVCPEVITLDKVIARAQHMIGKVDALAALFKLDIDATKKAIYKDRFILAEPNMVPRLVDDEWHTGESGRVNFVMNARSVQEIGTTPDQGVFQRMSSLMQYARQDAGITGLSGGDVTGYGGGLRTGRGMDTISDIAVSPRTQELQEIMAESLHQLVRPMFDMYRGYWGARSFSMATGLSGNAGHVDFKPDQDLAESSACSVTYPIPGADREGTTVRLGQLVGAKMMSARSAMEKHPDVDDPIEEQRLILDDALTNMSLEALNSQAQSGVIAPIDMAVIHAQVMAGKTLPEAIQTAHEAAQRRQATQAGPAGPGEVAPPQSMPGLGAPGQGAEQPPGGPGGGGPANIQEALAAMGASPPVPQTAPPQPVPVH